MLAEGKEWECHLRGKHKIKNVNFLPGDKVLISIEETGMGLVEGVLPRKNQLIRPTIANVDQLVIIASLAKSVTDLVLVDRLLVIAEAEQIQPLLVLNKADLLEERQYQEIVKLYQQYYQVVVTSTKMNIGIDNLRDCLADKISVFAGPSGVGKSSLLNKVQKDLKLKSAEVSKKTGRGRHTTRHVSLLPLESGGMVADTPGFSRLELPKVAPEEMGTLFPEFAKLIGNCKFRNCFHDKEPHCAVKEAVEEGKISSERYKRYLQFLEELKNKELKY